MSAESRLEWFSQRGLVEYELCYPQPEKTLTCRTRLEEKGDSKKRNSNQAEEKSIRSELVIGRICHSNYGPTFSPSNELRGRDCLGVAVKGRPYNAMLTQRHSTSVVLNRRTTALGEYTRLKKQR